MPNTKPWMPYQRHMVSPNTQAWHRLTEGDRLTGRSQAAHPSPRVFGFKYHEVMKKGTPRRLKPKSQTARLMVMSSGGLSLFLFLQ